VFVIAAGAPVTDYLTYPTYLAHPTYLTG